MEAASRPLTAHRLATIARAAVESRRFASPQTDCLDRTWAGAIKPVEDKQRKAVLNEINPLLSHAGARRSDGPTPALGSTELGGASEVLRQRASLELKLKTEQERLRALEQAHTREMGEHRQATEALQLQQRKLKDLQADRSKLLSDVSELESKLRMQINLTEQSDLKYEKLKAQRQTMGDQATDYVEQINALKDENERLQLRLEAALKERDQDVATAQTAQASAEDEAAPATLERLWDRLNKEIPEVFVDTHTPNEKTFENIGDALVQLLRAFATIELHVLHLLKEQKDVRDKNDPLNHFHRMFSKNAGLAETLSGYVTTGRQKGNFSNLLRAHQVWVRAFATGPHKAVLRAPDLVAKELNYRLWDVKKGAFKNEDQAIGEYFKEHVHKAMPDKLGMALREEARKHTCDDYNHLMKQRA